MEINKILVCSKLNKVEKNKFDKVVYTDYDFEKFSKNYFNLQQINIESLDKKNYYVYKNFLENFDKDFSSKNKVAENVNFFYHTAIERCVKYSKIIEALFANLSLDSKKKNIFYLCKEDLCKFRFKFLLFYIKYVKHHQVDILEVGKIKKKRYYFKNFNVLYCKLLLNSFVLKIITIFKFLIQKNIFYLYNFKKRSSIQIVLDNINPSFLNNKNSNVVFLNTKKINKTSSFDMSFLESYPAMEKYLFEIIYDEVRPSLNLIFFLDRFFKTSFQNYVSRYLIYTFPPTIYDSKKALIIQLAKKYSFQITAFQHGADYAYQKNFISHFLKDFNNCDYFYSLFFDSKFFNKNYQLISSLFKIDFFKMVRPQKQYVFEKVWKLTSNFIFLKESENVNLFICSRYDCSLNEEMLNYENIFLEEIRCIQSLTKESKRLLVKLPEQHYFEYCEAIKPLLRKNDLLIYTPGIRKLLVLFDKINIFSVVLSTASLEAKLLNKTININKNSKLYYNEINCEIYKLLI